MATRDSATMLNLILKALQDDREQEGAGLGLEELRRAAGGTASSALDDILHEAIERGLVEPGEPDRFTITEAGLHAVGGSR